MDEVGRLIPSLLMRPDPLDIVQNDSIDSTHPDQVGAIAAHQHAKLVVRIEDDALVAQRDSLARALGQAAPAGLAVGERHHSLLLLRELLFQRGDLLAQAWHIHWSGSGKIIHRSHLVLLLSDRRPGRTRWHLRSPGRGSEYI